MTSAPGRYSSTLPLSPQTYARGIKACVHCGLCLPACPTYMANGLEADSPRGRIYLMKALADDRIQPTENVIRHLDLCLDCHACETACPSGVVYHELIEETRAHLAPRRRLRGEAGLVRWLSLHVFTRPMLLKLLLLPARLLQKLCVWPAVTGLSRLLPLRLAGMVQTLPPTGPLWPRRLAQRHPARGTPKSKIRRGGLTVGLHTGCIGSVLDAPLNRKAVQLLQHFGCEVVVPRGQRCCGAIHHHNGYPAAAKHLVEGNFRGFHGVDRIVSTIAGCGAMLKEYPGKFGGMVRDICELLAELAPTAPPQRIERTVTYHDACHLAHAQGVRSAPRKLLEMIPGLTIKPLAESDMCCGAAGTYGLDQHQMSRQLAARKLAHIRDTGATTIVTGNIGCVMQIAAEARRTGVKLDVLHPIDLLHEAYMGKSVNR